MIEGQHCFKCGYKKSFFKHWTFLAFLGKKGKTIFHEFEPVYAKVEVDACLKGKALPVEAVKESVAVRDVEALRAGNEHIAFGLEGLQHRISKQVFEPTSVDTVEERERLEVWNPLLRSWSGALDRFIKELRE